MPHNAKAIDEYLRVEPFERAVALIAATIRHDPRAAHAACSLVAVATAIATHLSDVERAAIAQILADAAGELIEGLEFSTEPRMNGATVHLCE